MKTTTAASFLFSLLPLALAQTPAPFGVIAARSASPIHLQDLNANNQTFWIGKETASFCPSEISDCPAGTETAFVGGDNTLALDVAVPAGQIVYVDASGALMFTEAHVATLPPGAITTGFSKTEGASFGDLGWGTGFLACSATGEAPWQIFVEVDGFDSTDCLGFDALTFNTTGAAAWQYE